MAPTPAPIFPFSAIVGQDDLKLALLLTSVDPLIGGVLAMGHRGTGKSTTVRALARVLPPLAVVRGCRFHCDPQRPEEWCSECHERFPQRAGGPAFAHDPSAPGNRFPEGVEVDYIETPFVDLPLGTTEDRLLGSLDMEKALREGIKAFEPGLLARAHRGFLYVDEVNLLDDWIVDRLLDTVAAGWHVVEREGISLRHPARFILVGSGNPEEGELRPQLVDRFGLSVTVETPTDIDERVAILRRRDAFERDPAAFVARFQPEEERLRRRIAAARRLLPSVEVPTEVLRLAASLCAELGLDGHRGELTLMRTSAALAAWEGRPAARRDDVVRIAPLALLHRLRPDPYAADDARGTLQAAMARVGAGSA